MAVVRAALVTAIGEPLRAADIPVPRPGPGEVLIELKACGVCFSDLKAAAGAARRLPLVPGHEAVGVVAEAGPRVTGFAHGERVGVHAVFACGRCEQCLLGEEEACIRGLRGMAGFGHDGGYAQYMTAPAASVVRLPAALGFAAAAPLFCAGLTSFAALRNGGLRPGQRVAVIGVGGLGHLAISIAAAMGARVYAVTGSPDKIAAAQARGAVLAGDAAAVADAVRGEGGAHLVLNTADSLRPVTALVPALARRATIALVAGDGTELGITPADFGRYQLRVLWSFFGSRRDLRDLLALAAEHDIRPQTERYPLDEVNAVHGRLRANQVRYRAVIEPPAALPVAVAMIHAMTSASSRHAS